jgi:hypothetical protein
MVTRALEQAIQEVARLSEEEQDSIARAILELISEREWQKRFEATGDILDKLADEALHEHRAGLSESLDPDQL